MERHLKLFALSHRALLKRKLESMGKVEKISKGSTKSDKEAEEIRGNVVILTGKLFTLLVRSGRIVENAQKGPELQGGIS